MVQRASRVPSVESDVASTPSVRKFQREVGGGDQRSVTLFTGHLVHSSHQFLFLLCEAEGHAQDHTAVCGRTRV